METDKTTLADLSIFHHQDATAVFDKLNFTHTAIGKEYLFQYFNTPFDNLQSIEGTQALLRCIIQQTPHWPTQINNGTLMVIDKFYSTPLHPLPATAHWLNSHSYKLLHAPDFSLVRYSIQHFTDLLQGLQQIIRLFLNVGIPEILNRFIERAHQLLQNITVTDIGKVHNTGSFTAIEIIRFGYFLRHPFKKNIQELIAIYGKLDAWHSMAKAIQHYQLCFPHFIESTKPCLKARGLFHLLLSKPVPYHVLLDEEHHFMFLTGANMAGKSTFIKAVGIATYLSHLGMGVPATEMQLSLFDGMVSNINVVDNISRGESYFFNEVQRVKHTILKINNGKKYLVLIDELFKGTNVQDAMKCSSTVIKGLLKIAPSTFILSTHLYEIAEELKDYAGISFQYFETAVSNDQLLFNYQLKEGISNDRLGYLILQQQQVVALLEGL
jgi:DNA mismatch repair protein MutS